MSRHKAILLAALGFFLSELPGLASPDRFERARKLIQEAVENGVPAAAVGVARGRDILWEEAFGLADPKERVPATTDTMFSLASVSKPFTATALMVLVERGSIELDGPIDAYLGDASLTKRVGGVREATVRQIANHTAGLPLHHHFFPAGEPYRRPSLGETIRRYGNLVRRPGESYQYSNLGYAVLEHAIEQVSGRPFERFLREEVFAPLGLHHTSVLIDSGGEERVFAARYDPDGERLPFYDFDHRGASAIFASIHDLVRFGVFHVRQELPGAKPILSHRSIEEMQKPTGERALGGAYGVGWLLDETELGDKLVWHTGGMPGVSASLALIPRRELVVAVLASARTDLPRRVTESVFSSLLPRRSRHRTLGLASRERRRPEKPRPGSDPPRSARGLWTGTVETYRGSLPLVLRIEEGTGIRARLGSQPETPVVAAVFQGDRLTGQMTGDIGTDDANRREYVLRFSLVLEDGQLYGSLTALALRESGLPFGLSHFVELRRAGAAAQDSPPP